MAPPFWRTLEEQKLEATIALERGILEPARATPEDSIWVDRCKAGDPDAFEPLVQKFAGRIHRLAWGILGERLGDVDAAVQEIFLKAYLALPKFRGDAKFSTWLYRIAVNHCRDIIRRSPPPTLPLEEDSLPAAAGGMTAEAAADNESPEALAAEKESAAKLQSLLGELKERHRSIIVMRELEGMSYDEIGEALRIPPGTVRSRLNRARASLLRAAEKMREER